MSIRKYKFNSPEVIETKGKKIKVDPFRPWKIPGVPDEEIEIVVKPIPRSVYKEVIKREAKTFKALADV